MQTLNTDSGMAYAFALLTKHGRGLFILDLCTFKAINKLETLRQKYKKSTKCWCKTPQGFHQKNPGNLIRRKSASSLSLTSLLLPVEEGSPGRDSKSQNVDVLQGLVTMWTSHQLRALTQQISSRPCATTAGYWTTSGASLTKHGRGVFIFRWI
jgi:hypothetical protein